MTATLGVSAALLAGGASRRMGTDKAALATMDGPLGPHLAGFLCQHFTHVAVVERAARRRDIWPQGIARLTDSPDRPPCALTGILTALEWSPTPWLMVMACDMPFPSAALVTGLCQIAKNEQPDLVVPSSARVVHPLHAVYHRRLIPALANALEQDQLRLQPFATHHGHVVPESTLRGWQPSLAGLINVNTPEQWAEARHARTDRE